jgi:uncharacterized membrane protein
MPDRELAADEDLTGHISSSTLPYVSKIYFSPLIDRALKLSLPFILCAVYLLFLKYVYVPDAFYQIAGLMLLYFLPPAGKETVIPLGIASGYSWYLMAISLTVLDVLTCMFMIWNFDLICKAPVFGAWTETCMKAGQKFLNRFPWVRRLSVIGLGIFVLLPFQGSGGIASSVLGKMIGLPSWYIFFAVSIGSFIGSVALALGFYSLEQYFNIDPFFLFIGAVIVVVIVLAYRYFPRKKKRSKTHDTFMIDIESKSK